MARLAGALLRGGVPPELAELGLPGADLSGVWVGKGLRDTRSPPGAFAGLGEVRGGACCDGGGFPWRSSPERGIRGSGRTYWSWQLVQKEEKGVLRLTEGVRASRKALQGADVVDRRRRRAAVVEGSGGGRLGASGPGGSTKWDQKPQGVLHRIPPRMPSAPPPPHSCYVTAAPPRSRRPSVSR